MRKKNVKLGEKTNVGMNGTFILKVNRDPQKFTLTNINSYVPQGKTVGDRKRFMSTQGEVDTLFIDKISTTFKPDENQNDRHNIEVLIQHFDVFIPGIPEKEWKELVRLNIKKANW